MSNPLIIDANNLCMRNIMNNAMDDLKAGGVFTGGVYGTLRSLMLLLGQRDLYIGNVTAFFDCGVPARRMKLIPEFKQERKEKREMLTPEEKAKAYAQMDLCWEMFELLGITVGKYQDREADDDVAAAVRAYVEWGETPIVASGDHDLYQTVVMGAKVWDLGKKTIIDRGTMHTEMKIAPECFLLYRTLTGDNSDGIKGAGGVGDARAVELIHELQSDYDVASNGGYDFYDESPSQQLYALVCYLKDPTKRPKITRQYEQNIIDQFGRLRNVMQGIDLSNSFGPLEVIQRKLAVAPPPPDKMKFLSFCNRLRFKSVLGNPDMYFRPFKEAYARRLPPRDA